MKSWIETLLVSLEMPGVPANDTALLSLTAHWVTNGFKRNSAVLNAHCLTESHTGEYIAAQVHSMLKEWDIRLERVHIMLLSQITQVTILCSLQLIVAYYLKQQSVI